jgi:hypothetical protein
VPNQCPSQPPERARSTKLQRSGRTKPRQADSRAAESQVYELAPDFLTHSLRTIADKAHVGHPRDSPCHIGYIAEESVANLAEARECQISFTPLDSSKVTLVQSAILGKTVLAKPLDLPLGLNPATQP